MVNEIFDDNVAFKCYETLGTAFYMEVFAKLFITQKEMENRKNPAV